MRRHADIEGLEARLALDDCDDAEVLRDKSGRRLTVGALRSLFALVKQAGKLSKALRRFDYQEDNAETPWLCMQGNDGASTMINLNIPTLEVGILADCVNEARDALREYDAVRSGEPMPSSLWTVEPEAQDE